MKYTRIPFNLELAKEITNGTKKGKIVTRRGKEVRILCFDANVINFPIIALIKEDGGDSLVTRTNDGKVYSLAPDNDPRSLMLEIPEQDSFKDGDILYVKTKFSRNQYIFIYNKEDNYKTTYHISLDNDKILHTFGGRITNDNDISELRLATKEEKQELINALKNDESHIAKKYLEKFCGVNKNQKYKFKPFDKVLVRNNYNEKWNINLFSYITNDDGFNYVCINQCWRQCIPYNEQTAHLLGTIDNFTN